MLLQLSEVPGIMANNVKSVMNAVIRILQSSDVHTTIWVLVNEAEMIRALYAPFKLGV